MTDKLKRVGPSGTFQWVYEINSKALQAWNRRNDAIAKVIQGHGEFLSIISEAQTEHDTEFMNTVLNAYRDRDLRVGRLVEGTVKTLV
jgi:hypothetical protein